MGRTKHPGSTYLITANGKSYGKNTVQGLESRVPGNEMEAG